MAVQPKRGEVWIVELDPIRGHEQAGTRPVLIVSADRFNSSAAQLVFVAPITRTDRKVPFHVPLAPPEGGLRHNSFVLCDAVRSISIERLVGQPWGRVSGATLDLVGRRLRMLLEL